LELEEGLGLFGLVVGLEGEHGGLEGVDLLLFLGILELDLVDLAGKLRDFLG
jgi:hypothetical protein